MPSTLVLTIPSYTTKAAMLHEATVLNKPFFFTYTWEHNNLQQEKKEMAEKTNPMELSVTKGLTKLHLFSDSEQGRRMTLYFISKESLNTFLNAQEEFKLPFYTFHIDNAEIVGISTHILENIPFKQLKSFFLNYFNLSETLI